VHVLSIPCWPRAALNRFLYRKSSRVERFGLTSMRTLPPSPRPRRRAAAGTNFSRRKLTQPRPPSRSDGDRGFIDEVHEREALRRRRGPKPSCDLFPCGRTEPRRRSGRTGYDPSDPDVVSRVDRGPPLPMMMHPAETASPPNRSRRAACSGCPARFSNCRRLFMRHGVLAPLPRVNRPGFRLRKAW